MFEFRCWYVVILALSLVDFSACRSTVGNDEKLFLIWPTYRNLIGSDGRTTLQGPGISQPPVHSLSVFKNSTVRTSTVLGRAGSTLFAVVSSEDNQTLIANITGGAVRVLHTIHLGPTESLGSCPPLKIPPSPVLLSNGLAVVVSSTGYLFAIDIFTGKQLTQFVISAKAPVCVSAAVNKDGTVLYGVASDGTLAAFSSSNLRQGTKTPLWTVLLNGQPVSMPTVGPYDGSVYVALTSTQFFVVSQSGKIMCNRSTGFEVTTTVGIWACELGKVYHEFQSSANYTCDGHKNIGLAFYTTKLSRSISNLGALRNQSVEVHLKSSRFLMTPRRQAVAQRHNVLELNGLDALSSPTMFLTAQPQALGTILFIDAGEAMEGEGFLSGKTIWTISHLGKDGILSSPAIDKDGVVYIGTLDPPKLVALSANTGKIYWELPVDSAVISSPAIGDENNVVFISSKGTLYNLVGKKPAQVHIVD